MREIIQVTRCTNPKGRRYNEEWILLCILMRMKSVAAYNFLRDNHILPLPCIRTIQRYLSLIDTPCGFDNKFFEMFKLILEKKEDKQKYGVTLLDEIHLRENIYVNSKKLTYTGLIDFGIDGPQPSNINEKVDHGLVIMFHPIADSYSQLIGVFASRGSVTGEMLAQLVIKAISLLENIGAKVHGVITDGAATNRKFWTLVGVSGKKDNLSPEEKLIKWDYFRFLHNKDKTLSGEMRICPRITKNHLELINVAKMRVLLAVQVFSKSMAHGLRFYKNFLPELVDSDCTANFCDWVKDLFDALNQKKGLKVDDKYYKILEESLKKLNNWEQNVDSDAISKNNFLTKQTAEGLRVTIKSTLELVQYLTLNVGFDYVSTGRLNQDSLERFFGTVRHAAGSNDHPGTPTFLQIYKILSTFSILKPPKYGNCIFLDTKCDPTISISEIKSLYSHQNKLSTAKLKEKLDSAINNNNEFEQNFVQFMDQDYNEPEIIDCVIYYVTGYLSNHILKSIQCDICKNAFTSSTDCSFLTAVLSNMKTEGRIIHPNLQMYNFIKYLEMLFIKHCHRFDVFELIIQSIYTPVLSFPCKKHGDKVLAQIIEFYVALRMRQYANIINNEKQKVNQRIKKTSKFYKS